MKKLLFIAVLALPLCSISAKKAKKETVVLANEIDSVSYAFGANVANSLAKQMEQLPGAQNFSKELFLKAFATVFNEGDSLSLIKIANTNMMLERYFVKMEEAKFKENKEAGEKYLANNGKCGDVVTLPSGLQYQILTKGDGPKPTLADRVKVHYVGTLIDGTEFDSSYRRGTPAEFGVTQVIKGWTEALQLMPVGSKWRLFIPYNLAYGDRQMPGSPIQPYSTLIFDVELLDIVQ